jgi:hypothetical protein
MFRGLPAAIAAILSVLASPVRANATSMACPGFEEGGSGTEAVNQFYAMRAMDILIAGLLSKREALDQFVATDAKFTIWDADSDSCCRGQGPNAAIAFAHQLQATRYQFWSDWSMLSVRPTLKCEWSVAVIFTTNDRNSSVIMDYKFEDGRLVSAKGHRVHVVQGQIP